MKLSNHSAVPVYTISGSGTARPLPEWLARRRKRSLKNDPDYASRVELLQDFGFEEASHCIRVSEDGQWVVSTGTYKPQIHTHYLPHLSLSYARHTISLNTTFVLLSEDYTKQVHLQADRSIEFHTPQGCHYTARIPRYGRDLKYDRRSTEILVPAVGVDENGQGEVYRLNLETGRFMLSYAVAVEQEDRSMAAGDGVQGGIEAGAVNTAAIAEESHNLLAFGTSLGTVEFWDPRSKNRVGILQGFPPDDIEGRQEVTALEFHQSGLSVAAGSSGGIVKLYDLRSPAPLLTKDHGYGFPIQDLVYLTSPTESRMQSNEPRILVSDKRSIKIWDTRDGSPWTSVEPANNLSSVAWCRGSGLILTANEGTAQNAFFIPQLGPAPKWCAFLDNIVEEMAEDPNDPNAFSTQRAGEVYDNYKFLTVPQLEALNMGHLIGTTNLLRPYMHGYFVAQRLYEEAKVISDPFVWEEQKARRIKEKVESERESRIRGNKKITTKVNRKLAERILEKAEREERYKARKVLEQGGDEAVDEKELGEKQSGFLNDPRFAALFQDEDFAIDESSREYQLLNPSSRPTENQSRKKLTAVEQEEEDDITPSSDDSGSSTDDEASGVPVTRKEQRINSSRPSRVGRQPQMKVSSSREVKSARDRSFGSRKVGTRTKRKSGGIVGEQQVSFVPERKSKKAEPPSESNSNGKPGRRDKGRRSASGNVFRNM